MHQLTIAVLLLSLIIGSQSAAHARPLALTKLSDDFDYPVHLTAHPREPGCLLISEHAGLVKKFCKDATSPKELIDLRDVINPRSSRGLLGVAMQRNTPGEHTGLFLSYIDTQGDLLVVRFPLSEGRLLDDNDMSVVIKIARIAPNDHGSALGFLPDGTLMVTSGDGETEVKNSSHAAQSKASLLGKVLRLHVTGSTGYKPAGDRSLSGFLPEVWAIGLRNPDQLAIDHQTGAVLVADNGASTLELNLIQAGRNYGWDVVEDRTCRATACNTSDFTPPVVALPRKDVHSKLISGGVYHGTLLPELRGSFIFAEALSGALYSAKPNHANPWPHKQIATIPGKTISALSEGGDGEMYLASADGDLFQLSEGSAIAD